ncbi:hypothetical protein RB614_32795 [Phytohabitans sp. ZYX-F-186]|uniref:CdaR GGDEF-like domain-containing protein n=1 Tax=Phytohabitans maris TaxID=3071409 RepID=A0ABU0ZQN1_9ACTN|nr:hypothetical protein [Phytohabitans sp. ZYX-F-186]MDQ7909310.1 hypothetical protein [Phytohabitans sp. ZYX-F-186]
MTRGRRPAFAVSGHDLGSPTEQVRRLEALVNTGSVRVRTAAESKNSVIPSVIELIDSSSLDTASLESIFRAFTRNRQLLPRLADLEATGHLTHLLQQMRRYQGLKELKLAVADPDAAVAALCRLLRREWWVFGGHLEPWISDEVIPGLTDDLIAMVRYDSAIHVVIVGPPAVPDLVTAVEGGGFALSPLVAAAADRARGLVRFLEERRRPLSDQLQLECGRAFVTILLGHPDHVPGVEPQAVREEIRVLNTFATGITVITYEELVNVAEQTLSGAGEPPP